MDKFLAEPSVLAVLAVLAPGVCVNEISRLRRVLAVLTDLAPGVCGNVNLGRGRSSDSFGTGNLDHPGSNEWWYGTMIQVHYLPGEP